MPLEFEHILVSTRLEPTKHVEGNETVFRVAATGTFQVPLPGRLKRYVAVAIPRWYHNPQIPGEPLLPKGGLVSTTDYMECTLTIIAPDGAVFAADEVTLEDLRKYRDIRGFTKQRWAYTLGGERRYRLNDAIQEKVGEPDGQMILYIVETVKSESAEPLIYSTELAGSEESFAIDLWRVGRLEAVVEGDAAWSGTMRLLDPDGAEVATSSTTTLSYEIDLVALRKSRDPRAQPRYWSIEVRPQGGTSAGARISAHVFGTSRITTEALSDRILNLIGENGRYIELSGRNKQGKAQGRLVIHSETAAEAFERFGLLEGLLTRYPQDPPLVATDIIKGAEYTVFSMDGEGPYGTRIDVSAIKLGQIHVSFGAGTNLGPIPTVSIEAQVDGEVVVELGGMTVGRAHVEDDKVQIEVGIKLDSEGVPRFVTWMPDDVIDAHIDEVALVATSLLPLGVLAAGAAVAIVEYLEDQVNDDLVHAVDFAFGHPELASRILMLVMGAHLTYTSIGVDGEDFVFEYTAPLEPDPKPSDNYVAVVGRSVHDYGDGRIRMEPRTVGDTWAADNLRSKIDHIVYIMMENRSYDHVLGYRAQDPINEPSDGLTPALVAAIEGDPKQHTVRNLALAGFAANEVDLMTQLPQGVGHSYKRVTTQLSKVIPGPNGGFINSPEGFVKDFIDYVEDDSLQTYDWKGVVPDDCLGYYDGTQLPVYEYLARNYAYCDRFFCSHPGPTLPNRQFSLTGDVDYDRVGVPILENNHGDNFQLSRAQTIIDVLEKRGVSWRVYESAPSVAMLRMFARYASNTDRIRPVGPDPGVDPSATETLEADLAANGLPSFCIIEPAMHHHPQDDDHPDADMWRGQRFIWRVYKALRALPTWERTLLIITYDEHGGLYDHVVPPLAEILDAGITGWGASGQPVVHDGFEDDEEESGAGTGTGTGTGNGPGWLGRLGRERYGPGDGGPTTVATGEETDPAPEPDRRVAIPYGVRVPTFLVSPWVPAGRGPSEVYDFCSILKTVLARFTDDRPFMSDRVTAARSLEAYLSEPSPRVVAEEPPEPTLLSESVRSLARDESAIVTPPLHGRDMRDGPVESHEIMGHAARLLGR